MLKSAILFLSLIFISNSGFAFTLQHPVTMPKCPDGYKLEVEKDHHKRPKKICCVREKDDDCDDNSGGSCGGGNNGGGHDECNQVPNCKLELIAPITAATASNSNSKCRKTGADGNIIPGDTCAGTWIISNGKCCLPRR